jgi:hypothetical protein
MRWPKCKKILGGDGISSCKSLSGKELWLQKNEKTTEMVMGGRIAKERMWSFREWRGGLFLSIMDSIETAYMLTVFG